MLRFNTNFLFLFRYNNTASEPMLDSREVLFEVFDGVSIGFASIVINLQSIDDNRPQVSIL